MDQKPIGSEAPLIPPTADVAQAYLDEIGVVVERREAHVDRRRMAWLAFAEAIVLSGYLTIMMFGFGNAVDSSRFITILFLFLVWIQLAGELRESYGGQARRVGRNQRAYTGFAVLGGLSVAGGIWLQFAGVPILLLLRFVPGAVMLLVFGGLAVRDLRRYPHSLPRERLPLTKSARGATVGLGVALGLGAWATGSDLFTPFFSLTAMALVLAWSIAAYTGSRVPALGAIWRWPQWAALAVGSGAVAGLVLLDMHTDIVSGVFAASIGAAVAVLFAIAASTGGRRVE